MGSVVSAVVIAVLAVLMLVVCENNNRLYAGGAVGGHGYLLMGVIVLVMPTLMLGWDTTAARVVSFMLLVDSLYSIVRVRRGDMPTDVIDLPGMLLGVLGRRGAADERVGGAGAPSDVFRE